MAANRLAIARRVDVHASEPDTFARKERPFHSFAPAVAAQAAAGGDDAVARYVRAMTVPHDVPDGPGGAGSACQGRNLPICRHAPGRNASYEREHVHDERTGRSRFHRAEGRTACGFTARAAFKTCPSTFDRLIPQSAASV